MWQVVANTAILTAPLTAAKNALGEGPIVSAGARVLQPLRITQSEKQEPESPDV